MLSVQYIENSRKCHDHNQQYENEADEISNHELYGFDQDAKKFSSRQVGRKFDPMANNDDTY